MMRTLIGQFLALMPACICATSIAQSATDAGLRKVAANLPVTAEIAQVQVRSAGGRLDTFSDALGREFVIIYDTDSRPIRVAATGGRNIMDVEAIRYTQTGQLASVSLASGYEITVAYSQDGMQAIRDRYGGILTRLATSSDLSGASIHSDPTGKLVALVTRLDALFAAIQSDNK